MFAFRRRRCACCDVQLARDDGILCADCIEQQLDAERAAREEIELANRHALLAEEDAERRAERDRAAQDYWQQLADNGNAMRAEKQMSAEQMRYQQPAPRPDPAATPSGSDTRSAVVHADLNPV